MSSGRQPTIDELSRDPHQAHDALRANGPLSWVPSLNGWLVTDRRLAIEVMRDSTTFTVDHPGFTTAQVIGPSMLSLDGVDHRRHRDPFAAHFRTGEVRERFETFLAERSTEIVDRLRPSGRGELRSELAALFAVHVVAELLDLVDIDTAELLRLYRDIVGAVNDLSVGEPMPPSGPEAVEALRLHVETAIAGDGMLATAAQVLTGDEVLSNAAVMLFGGIETNEGMTASALWYLLSVPELMRTIERDRSLVSALVEESLRLEPAAARVDRFATRALVLAGQRIARDDLLIVSLAAANRDPAAFDQPHEFRLDRSSDDGHLAFAQGPHACIAQHLARMETRAMVNAVLDRLPEISLDRDTSKAHEGLVFRKPVAVQARWITNNRGG
ncbi:MAG: cytochrome P450 [Acidimicrobiia bacterium]|nr:cytochrome P450 [Acidimicrobiia bacterium]